MRELNKDEASWIEQALKEESDLKSQDITQYLEQIKSLKVVEECDCGDRECKSVRFQHYRPGYSYGLADASINRGTNKEFLAIVFVDRQTRLITEIETVK